MNDAAADRKFANTLARGLSILSVFRASDDGLTHAQIAERTNLPKPTISRLTYTLCCLGYLTHGSRNDRFRLGPSALMLGSVSRLSVPFLDLVSDDMQKLADATGMLCLIAVRDGDEMVFLKTWRPAANTTFWQEPGQRVPVYGSSAGMATLASMSDDEFEAINPNLSLRRYRKAGYDQLLTDGFATTPIALRYNPKAACVSVPFYAAEFGVCVSFSCSGIPDMLPAKRITDEVGPALRDLVRRLEGRTGQVPAVARRG